ncbi:MAG: hypothetical protein J6J33_04300 [Clostridia bacterium]|nr:hypothetical protein [Clostridia bacterium]
MEKLNNTLNDTMKNIMVRCMTNPDNKDFYLGTLTVQRIGEILRNFNDPDFTKLFWSAFEVAQAQYISHVYQLESVTGTICPECYCLDYIPGVKCPNCDHYEEA